MVCIVVSTKEVMLLTLYAESCKKLRMNFCEISLIDTVGNKWSKFGGYLDLDPKLSFTQF